MLTGPLRGIESNIVSLACICNVWRSPAPAKSTLREVHHRIKYYTCVRMVNPDTMIKLVTEFERCMNMFKFSTSGKACKGLYYNSN